MNSGWHRKKGNKRHPTKPLACCWVHDSGAEIYQGRPEPSEPRRFVYLLRRPDGSEVECSLLGQAKALEAPAPKPIVLDGRGMTLDQLAQQIEEYKRDHGKYIGKLRVRLSGYPDRMVESLALVETGDSSVPGFDYAEIVG